MRYVLIDPRHRGAWQNHTPHTLGRQFMSNLLGKDVVTSIELTDDMNLWLPVEPRGRPFRFFGNGPEYYGAGVLCGRTRLGEFKSLPRHYNIEMIRGWLSWPTARPAEWIPSVQSLQRPAGLPLAGLLPSQGSYHGSAPKGARENRILLHV